MSSYKDTILTQRGSSIASDAAKGKLQFTITRTVASNADFSSYNDDNLAALTKLPNEIQNGSIVDELDDTDQQGTTGTQVRFTNTNVKTAFKINAVGLYAKINGDDTEYLYSITLADSPYYMNDYSNKVYNQFDLIIYVVVGDKANLNLNINPDNFVTVAYLNRNFATKEDVAKSIQVANKYTDNHMPKLPKEVVIATKPESPSLEIKTNDSSVDYTITPGLYFGRAEIEKFVLYYKKHTDTDYSHIDVDIHQLSGSLELQGGNQYDFYATAVNQSYESDGSAAQSYILGKVPYNVKLSYKVDVSSKTINYTITADSNADTPVTNYRLMFKDTNDANWKWNDIKENNYKIDGCTLGHTYLLKAIAFNAVGESNVTDMQTVTVGNVLSAPQLNLSFNGSLNYQITPADDSSNPLKLNYYTIYYKRESDMDWQTFRTTNLTGTIPNAEIGQTYLSQVSASNSVGESQKSNVVSIKMIDTSKIDSLLTFKTDQPQDVTSISYTVNQSLLGFYKTKVASITVWQHYGNTHSPSDVSSSTVLNSSRVNLQSGNGTLRLMSGNAYGAYGKYGCYLYVYAKLIDGSADEFVKF